MHHWRAVGPPAAHPTLPTNSMECAAAIASKERNMHTETRGSLPKATVGNQRGSHMALPSRPIAVKEDPLLWCTTHSNQFHFNQFPKLAQLAAKYLATLPTRSSIVIVSAIFLHPEILLLEQLAAAVIQRGF